MNYYFVTEEYFPSNYKLERYNYVYKLSTSVFRVYNFRITRYIKFIHGGKVGHFDNAECDILLGFD